MNESLKDKYGLSVPKFNDFSLTEDSEGTHLFWRNTKVRDFSVGVDPKEVKKMALQFLKREEKRVTDFIAGPGEKE